MADHRDMASHGVTNRRALYWTSQGYLRPDGTVRGSGHLMTWSAGEVTVAALMVRLTAAGMDLAVAHRVARGDRVLGPGIRIVIDEASGGTP